MGGGQLENADGEIVTFHAPAEPGLTGLRVTARQGDVVCEAEGTITITESLLAETEPTSNRQGLPDYTFERAPGELWRSRYDSEQNVIVINNGHRDFVYASRSGTMKLRYIARLFAKGRQYHDILTSMAHQHWRRAIGGGELRGEARPQRQVR